MTLTIASDLFLLDDQPFRILSGVIHFFRVMPEYWRDPVDNAHPFKRR